MDTFFEKLRLSGAISHIIFARLTVDALPDVSVIRKLLEEKFLRFPRFHSQVVFRGGKVIFAELPVESLDWGYHVQLVEDGLSVEDLQAQGLDLEKPRWKVLLSPSLGVDRRPAVIFVADHVVGDGVALSEAIFSLCTGNEPSEGNLLPKRRERTTSGPLAKLSTVPSFIVNTIRMVYWTVPNTRDACCIKAKKGSTRSLNRVFAESHPPISVADVKACKNLVPSTTVTEVLLATLSLAVRRTLEHCGDSKTPVLNAGVTCNLRSKPFWEDPGANFGNFAWALTFPLDLTTEGNGAPEGRLSALWSVRRRVDTIKNEAYTPFFFHYIFPHVTSMSPQSIGKIVADPSVDGNTLIISPLVGPEQAVSIGGKRITAMDFFCATTAQLYVGFLSYAGEVRMTLSADPAVMDQDTREFFCKAFNEEFYKLKEELEAAGDAELEQIQTISSRRGFWCFICCNTTLQILLWPLVVFLVYLLFAARVIGPLAF